MRASPGQFGPFQIQEQISQRPGIGVYAATDRRTKQTVVLYVLDLHTESLPAVALQLRLAAQRISQLRHDHIVAFDESGEQDRYFYIATVPLAGTTLSAHLQQRKTLLETAEAMALIQQIAAGLDAAHQQQVLHLALTPDEIWITGGGKAQVLGLGVPGPARVADSQAAGDPAPVIAPGVSPYTAPEQVQQGARIDQRTDVYSLGAIAYTLLAGQPPLQAEDPAQLALEILHRTPAPPEQLQPGLSPGVSSVFRFALAKDPQLRYASAGELATALWQAQHWAAGEAGAQAAASPMHIRRSPDRRLAGLLLLLPMIVLAGLWFAWGLFQPAPPEQAGPDSLAVIAGGARAQGEQPAADTPLPTTTFTPEPISTATPQPTTTDTPLPTATFTVQPTSTPASTRWPSLAATRPAVSTQAAPTPTPGSRPALSPTSMAGIVATTATTPAAAISPRPATATAATTPASAQLATPTATLARMPAPLLHPQSQGFTLYFPYIAYTLSLEARVIRNANLRAGPGVNFPVLGNARARQTITLVACNPGCTWYQLANGAWIAEFLVQSAVDPSLLLPQLTPTPAAE